MRYALPPLLLLLAAGCATTPVSPAGTLARRIEDAHGRATWATRQAVAGDITVAFMGNEMLRGVMTYDYHRNLSRIETAGGTTLVFDGERAWISPATAEAPMARFHLLTWPYFLVAPFKLRDPGAHLEPTGRGLLYGSEVATARLTFDAGVGDAPDDWYVVYEDPGTSLLGAMGYIVTYGGRSVAEAEQEPHAIVYHDYELVGGVWLSPRWTFHDWSWERGPHGEPIGTAMIENLRFVPSEPAMFARPPDAREDPLP